TLAGWRQDSPRVKPLLTPAGWDALPRARGRSHPPIREDCIVGRDAVTHNRQTTCDASAFFLPRWDRASGRAPNGPGFPLNRQQFATRPVTCMHRPARLISTCVAT